MFKYEIRRVEDAPPPAEYMVYKDGELVGNVWWDEGKAYCLTCTGPLTGNSKSCPHAKAVKRKLSKTD